MFNHSKAVHACQGHKELDREKQKFVPRRHLLSFTQTQRIQAPKVCVVPERSRAAHSLVLNLDVACLRPCLARRPAKCTADPSRTDSTYPELLCGLQAHIAPLLVDHQVNWNDTEDSAIRAKLIKKLLHIEMKVTSSTAAGENMQKNALLASLSGDTRLRLGKKSARKLLLNLLKWHWTCLVSQGTL